MYFASFSTFVEPVLKMDFKIFFHSQFLILLVLFTKFQSAGGSLLEEMDTMNDLKEFRRLCLLNNVSSTYLNDSRSNVTVFAPVDDVFLRNPHLHSMTKVEIVSHIVDAQIPEIISGRKWEKELLIRNNINGGKMYITQLESNPGNFSYFANNGRICMSSGSVVIENQYLYKICSWIGNEPFSGMAWEFVRKDSDEFSNKRYNNNQLTQLKDILLRVPDVTMVIYGSSGWDGFHTFFLPNNKAIEKITNKNLIDRETLLFHVTGPNKVLFTESWLYDYSTHYYPSIRFATNMIENNFRAMLTVKNLTDRKTGRWDTYVVSNVFEGYSTFRRGAVWAKIVTPNIPVDNGVVHVIDTVLGIVSKTVGQMLQEENKVTTLMTYINTVGQAMRDYLTAQGGLVTFFAPINEAFDRIPDEVERRLMRDRKWLEQILKLHIVTGKDLTTGEMNNDTRANTVDKSRQLYFVKGEWPKNNITYYVTGGGVRAAIYQEDVAAVNGIIHYIDRVLGVPCETMFNIIQKDSSLQTTYKALNNTPLRYTLNPWEVLRPEQNFTFFVPTEEAWNKMPSTLRGRFFDGTHWNDLQFVFQRHLIQGRALMATDLKEVQYRMMNNDSMSLRQQNHGFELYWPYGNVAARLQQGGEIAAVNGFIHKIDNILVLEQDCSNVTAAANTILDDIAIFFTSF